ncbi:hypothetical protein [Tenacibaculum maritimum]|uniref:hypothetical protein n=1 Tax=Tenacibaculum maritimum TaxID=107401 RepID=UPI001330837F|nr:hypothetical protein [Tenacibaculum maritimum]
MSSSPETRVIDEESLTLLKETLRRFVDGIINSGCFSASNQEVANLLGSHSLTPAGFRTKFLKTVASKKR